MNNTTKRVIFLQKFAAFTAIAKAMGINFIITSFYRGTEEQNQRFDEGKSMCDGYDKRSKHQDWLAIDIAIIENGECVWGRTEGYNKLGKVWKDIFSGVWDDSPRGDLDDPYHFQFGGS